MKGEMIGRPKSRRWWRDRFVTLMIIPERTRRVHRIVVPFFVVKLGGILVSLSVIFLIIIGMDYVNVLRGMAENKRLKGENFKLQREMQLIRNKVESMDFTIERVRNYAKKLQLLTGQGDSASENIPLEKTLPKIEREPAMRPGKRTKVEPEENKLPDQSSRETASLGERVAGLEVRSLDTEYELSKLQLFLAAQSAFIAATPSLLPTSGYLSSLFGYRRHPTFGSYLFHAGVDIMAESGAPVRAPADGVILYSGYQSGYGKVIVIDHGYGIRTLFGHCHRLFKTSGLKVKRGEKIAEVGETGRATGPHLHYEVRKHGRPVNPVTFFSGARF